MLESNSSALVAVQAASGIPPDELSLIIRTILLVLIFIWAGYFFNSLFHHFRHNGLEELDVTTKIMRVTIVLVIAITLVYVT